MNVPYHQMDCMCPSVKSFLAHGRTNRAAGGVWPSGQSLLCLTQRVAQVYSMSTLEEPLHVSANVLNARCFSALQVKLRTQSTNHDMHPEPSPPHPHHLHGRTFHGN